MDIEEKFGISAAYILLNKGHMFDKGVSALDVAMGNDQASHLLVPHYLDIRACAGTNGYANGEHHGEVEMISLPSELVGKKVTTGKIEAIKADGDSMHPTIKNGDIIFICKKIKDIIDGKIYVLVYNDEVYVKRVFKRKNTIIIKPDNSIYPQDEVYAKDVRIVGQVIYNFTPLT